MTITQPRLRALLLLTTLLPSVSVDGQSPGNQDRWTLDRLAKQVEASIVRLEKVRLEASYTQTRNVNFLVGRDPMLVDGSGKLVYRGDQQRWFLRDDGCTFRAGKAETNPKTRISGYDGTFHYHGDLRHLTLAESQSRRAARPQGLFWETILTYDYLLRALRDDSSKVTDSGIDGEQEWVELESHWGSDDNAWKLMVRFDVSRGFLPLWQKVDFGGKPYAKSEISKVTRVGATDGWYPGVIHTKYFQPALGTVEKMYRIEKFELVDAFDKHAFRFEPPPGADVIDRRSNLAWHSDPWWDEMFPWTMQTLGFPRYQYQSLQDFHSEADPAIEGADAPEIQAARWLGEAPGPWDRAERKISVLFFWGSSASLSSPFPKWITELGQLDRLLEPFGGEVVVVMGSRTDAESLKKFADELMVEIPIAIDGEGGDNGATHQAFRLKHYYSVVVVDAQGKVRLVFEKDGFLLRDLMGKVLDEDAMTTINQEIQKSSMMSRAEHDAIKEHWINLRRETQGRGRITGQVTPSRNATVKMLPVMTMLIGSTPGGYMLFHDQRERKSIEVDAATGGFEFENLPKGAYELSVVSPDGKAKKTTVYLMSDDDQATHSFSLK